MKRIRILRLLAAASTSVLASCSLFVENLKPVPAGLTGGKTFRESVEAIALSEAALRAPKGDRGLDGASAVPDESERGERDLAKREQGGSSGVASRATRPAPVPSLAGNRDEPSSQRGKSVARPPPRSVEEEVERERTAAVRAKQREASRRAKESRSREEMSANPAAGERTVQRFARQGEPVRTYVDSGFSPDVSVLDAFNAPPQGGDNGAMATPPKNAEIEAAAGADVADRRLEPSEQGTGSELTLIHVSKALSQLLKAVDARTMEKHGQQWAYRETAALGGFAASAGVIANRVGLQNTGLGLLAGGLGLDQFYGPGQTMKIHMKGTSLFSCLYSELNRVSERDRVLALSAPASTDEGKAGALVAFDAVQIAIARIEEALVAYRLAVLSQEPAPVSKADFERFIKDFEATKITSDRALFAALAEPSEAQRRVDQAAARFVAFPVKMEVCLKTFSF